MSKKYEICENGVSFCWEIADSGELRLLSFGENGSSTADFNETHKSFCRAIELQCTGCNHIYHHAQKNVGTCCGGTLSVKDISDTRDDCGRIVIFSLANESLEVNLFYRDFDGVKAVRTFAEIKNISSAELGLEYISLFAFTGIDGGGSAPLDNKLEIAVPYNTWAGELAWQMLKPSALGYNHVRDFTLRPIEISSNGLWSTNGYLPMGAVLNSENETALMWQIENNGAWQWEIGDLDDSLYLRLSGPNENNHSWWKKLKPQESFKTCSCAVAYIRGDFDDALCEITKYRRKIKNDVPADKALPVIFNDYMKCMLCNATEEKLRPVIKRAAELGAEYFVMDAGWYSENDWENEVGEWKVNKKKFPNGLKPVCDLILQNGMKPGIWFEPECVSFSSPMARIYDDDCFFVRHGKRVSDHFRYQLDFRNEKVKEYLGGIIDRFYNEYSIRYFKFDYNIEGGIGTETDADSFGDGLLQHGRAFCKWIDSLMQKYPDIIIENCASGGLRMNYELLSRLSVQSVTDQEDYRLNGVIASSAATALTPEQAAFWVYPPGNADKYEIVYNLVNAMLHRFHLSGAVTEFDESSMKLIRSGIDYYKTIRSDIPNFLPFYPLGISSFTDEFMAEGFRGSGKTYIAVWRRECEDNAMFIPLKQKVKSARISFPDWEENSAGICEGGLNVTIGHKNSACIIELEEADGLERN